MMSLTLATKIQRWPRRWTFTLTAAACNLVRLPKLLAVA